MFLQRREESLHQPEMRVMPTNPLSSPSCASKAVNMSRGPCRKSPGSQTVPLTTLWPLQKRAWLQFPLSHGQPAPDPSFSSLLPSLRTRSLADSLCLVPAVSNIVEQGLLSWEELSFRANDLSQGDEEHGPCILRTQSPQTAIWFHLDVSRNNNKKSCKELGLEPQDPDLASPWLMM